MSKKPVVEFVPKHYTMNPETDEILPNGRYLRNGMRVLIDDESQRVADPYATDYEFVKLRVEKYNRWCTVSFVEINDRAKYQNEETVTFIGVYDDGTKRSFKEPLSAAWIVKISSMSEPLKNMIPARACNCNDLDKVSIHARTVDGVVEHFAGFSGDK